MGVFPAPRFFGRAMNKLTLILLVIGLILALIIILSGIIDEFLHGHDG